MFRKPQGSLPFSHNGGHTRGVVGGRPYPAAAAAGPSTPVRGVGFRRKGCGGGGQTQLVRQCDTKNMINKTQEQTQKSTETQRVVSMAEGAYQETVFHLRSIATAFTWLFACLNHSFLFLQF